jgi:hypothetical protein
MKLSILKTKNFLFSLIFGSSIFMADNLIAAITASFPNSNGTGTIGTYTYHCRNDITQSWKMVINLKSNVTGGSGVSVATVKVYLANSTTPTETVVVSIPNDNNFHVGHEYYVPVNSNFSGLIRADVEWASSTTEQTPSYFINSPKVTLFITNGVAENGGTVLAECHKVGGVVNVRLGGFATFCPGLSQTHTLEVQEVDRNTYANVGVLATGTLSATDEADLSSMTFSLTNFCTSKGLILTNGKLYRVQRILSGNVWAEKTIYFNYKTGTTSELAIMDYTYFNYLGGDAGEERNRANINVFQSDDVWNQLNSTGGNSTTFSADKVGYRKHQSPDYSTVNTNKMFTKINNFGCAASPANTATLRMFWTRARLGELWDKDWIYGPANRDAAGTDLGSEITISGASFSAPYNTNSAPILLPSISSNSTSNSYIITPKDWYAPNPANFNSTNGSMNGLGQPVICLLSRLQSNTSTFDPIVWEPSGNTTDIEHYVRNNNNVATRNTALVDGPQFLGTGGTGTGTTTTDFYTVIANNPSLNPTRICLRNISEPVFSGFNLLDYAQIQIGFTNGIWNDWVANGMQGSGFTVISPTLVNVTDPTEVCFDNITIGNDMEQQIGIRAIWNNEACFPVDSPLFVYALQQENMESSPTYDGSDVIYMFPAFGPECENLKMSSSNKDYTFKKSTFDELEISDNKRSNKKNNSTKINSEVDSKIIIYPNPATNQTIITVDNISSSSNIQLELFDMTGKKIHLEFSYLESNGIASYKINTSNLIEGIYSIKISQNTKTSVHKLIIQK